MKYKLHAKLKDFKFMIAYEQVKLVQELSKITKINKILDIGCEYKIASNTLKELGYKVKTLDIFKEYKPDYIGDITDYDFKEKFDLAICSSVLEYIHLNKLKKTLNNIKKICKYVIIGGVREKIMFSFMFRMPLIGQKYININLPWGSIKNPNYEWKLDSELPIKVFRKMLKSLNFKILKEKYLKYYPRYYYFVIENETKTMKLKK